MANFEGYLFKKTVTQGTSTIDVPFPNRYIALDTWSSTPNQREEIKAYRDDNTRDLTRVLGRTCPCGRNHIRLDRMRGRSDDMMVLRGVNIFPIQIEKQTKYGVQDLQDYR